VRLRPLLPYLCFASLITVAVILRVLSPRFSPVERFLNDPSIRSTDLTSDARGVLDFLNSASTEKIDWKINQNPQPGVHTLILFSGNKAKTNPAYADYVQTIAWVAEYDTIVVDVDYVQVLAEQLTSFGPPQIENPYERRFREDATVKEFLLWVLGHESGHAHYHDSTRHFWLKSFEAPDPADTVNQAVEKRADGYVALLVSSSPSQAVDLSEMLFGILNVNLEARMPKSNLVGPSIQMFSTDGIDVLASGTHPDFIVRAATILSEIHYPPGTEERYSIWARKLLDRIKSSKSAECSVMTRTIPVPADLALQQNGERPVVYRTPASLLLAPGTYQLEVSAKGFKTTEEQIKVPDCKHVSDVNIQMEKTPDPPKPPMTPLEQFVSRREQTIPKVAYAQSLQQQGHWEAAEWELERAVQIDPAWSKTLFLQAFVQEHDNNLTRAQIFYDRATQLKKAEIAAYELGAYRLDDIQTEMADDTRALLKQAGDEQARRSTAGLWLELGRYDLARPLVQQLQQRPGSCEDDVNLARYLLASSKIQDAVTLLQQTAACTGPEPVDGMIALATQLESVKQDMKAERWFVLAYKGDPENAWVDLADFLRRHNRAKEALPYALAAAKKTSDDTDALNEIAKIELQLGRTETAELWFKRALTTYTDNSDALVGLARVAGKRGQWEQAKNLCGAAVKGNSWDNFDGWVCLGDAEQTLGHLQEALTAYKNAIWLRPSDTSLSTSIAHLYTLVSDASRASLYSSFATPK
jgi:tetratricopeptide (TPR) repeat protein